MKSHIFGDTSAYPQTNPDNHRVVVPDWNPRYLARCDDLADDLEVSETEGFAILSREFPQEDPLHAPYLQALVENGR